MLFKQIAKHYLENPWEQQGEYVILQRQQKASLIAIYVMQKLTAWSKRDCFYKQKKDVLSNLTTNEGTGRGKR